MGLVERKRKKKRVGVYGRKDAKDNRKGGGKRNKTEGSEGRKGMSEKQARKLRKEGRKTGKGEEIRRDLKGKR